MKTNLKRFLAMLLAVVLTMGMAPMNVFADDGATELMVAEVNGVQYTSLKAAVAAVGKGETATIKILRDYTETSFSTTGKYALAVWLGNNRNIVLDLDGHTVTFDSSAYTAQTLHTLFYVASAGSSLTITGNGTVKYSNPAGTDSTMAWAQDGDIIIENGTFIAENVSDESHLFYITLNGQIAVEGGTCTKSANAKKMINRNDSATGMVTVTGGTFNEDILTETQKGEVIIHDDYELVNNGDGTWTVKRLPDVAEVNGVGYTTIQKAINAVPANGTATVTILADHTCDSYIASGSYAFAVQVREGKKITLDMAGRTVYFNGSAAVAAGSPYQTVFYVSGDGYLTITGEGTVNYKISDNTAKKVQNGFTYLVWACAGTVDILNGTFNAYHADTYYGEMIYVTNTGNINVKGGVFTQDTADENVFNKKDANTTGVITVTGGTYNEDIVARVQEDEITIPDDYELVNNGNGTWTVQMKPFVAEVNGVGYTSLAKAISAVPKNSEATIKILKDYTETHFRTTGNYALAAWIGNNRNITLDFDGHTVTFDPSAYANRAIHALFYVASAGSSLTITGNGTIKYSNPTGTDSTMAWAQNGDIIIENGTFIAENVSDESHLFYITVDGRFLVKGGSFNAADNALQMFNRHPTATGYATVTGGTFNEDILATATEGSVVIPDEYKLVDNGNGTRTVAKQPEIIVTFDDATALENFEYTQDTEAGTVILTKYIGSDAAVTVAPVYLVNDEVYTTILDSYTVFKKNNTITSVKIYNGTKFLNNTMSRLFLGCSKLVVADLNAVDATGVTSMSYMFMNCSKLATVDMTGVDTSQVTTMYAMFSKCGKLASFVGYENWDTGSLQDMKFMFNYVQSLDVVDLSKWDLSQVINSAWCFQYCRASEILLPANLKTISAGFLNHAKDYAGATFTIPAGVEKIGYAHTIYDFSDDDFVEFIVAEGNENYIAIDGILYSADGKEMLAIPRGKTFENDTYEIPEGVNFMGELSFSRNYNIHTVVLPNSYEIKYVPLADPRYILVDDDGNLNVGTNLSIAIYSYTGITDYAVKDDNPRYTSVDGIIYSKDMTSVVAIPSRYNKLLNIPEGVISWNHEAMWAYNSSTVDGLMSKFTGVSIPSTMTEISQDQIDKLNRLNERFATFEITVHEGNPVYGVDEAGNLVVKVSE